MFRKKLALAVLGMSLLAVPAMAQDATPEATEGGMPPMPGAIATGLSGPRGLSYDADGNLWIAEAGSGGSIVLPADPNATEGPGASESTIGLSSQVSMVAADGTQSVAIPFLFGVATPSESLGVAVAYNQGDAAWLVMSGAGPSPVVPTYAGYVLKMENVNGNWRIADSIDLYANEAANNPDGADPLDSNVNNIAWDADGTLYIVDTGANTIFTWGENGLTPWHIWTDDPVPTVIRFAADGSAYVGFLGQGIAPGAGKIEHYSADGSELIETFGGLTAVTDIAIGQDGNVYAVQLITAFGDQGPDMMSGSVVMVNADGATPVAEGLFMPYSLAQAPDGSWAVSIGTLAGPGNGAVIKLG
jgi:hypothetical protein